jgi:murein DD-endopeptidase MepM/ murein hydrolase activator NlpD
LKTGTKKIRWIVVAATAGVLAAALLWVVAGRLEGTLPVVVIDPAFAAVGQERIFALEVADPESGLRQVRLSLAQEGKPAVILVDKVYPAAGWFGGGARRQDRLELRLAPSEQGLGDGALSMTVEVRDNAWRNWWNGNRALIERRLVVDTRPPSIEVLSQAHNINQGGSGLVIYRVSEPCVRTGVRVGDTFYPGRPGLFEDSGALAAFIALDYDQGRDTPLAVVAEDEAGNTAQKGLAHHIRPKQWREDVLEISDGFLNAKMPELAALIPAPAPASPLDQYLKVNRDVRRADYERIQALTRKSDDRRHWHDTFIRLPGAANRALFADHRIYRYHGKEIDRQVHMGVDLASLANSPVPAANAGRVAFTGDLGIYGMTVLMDHGFGLFSMYSHLSRIDVAADQTVGRGATLGLTGMTGLAGGDHLHFSMLVRSTFVNPIEWWDDHWIRHNVTDKIEAVGK